MSRRTIDLGNVGRPTRLKPRRRVPKLLIAALILGVFGYGVYSVGPAVMSTLATIAKGPSLVLSYLRDNPEKLDQTDGHTNVLLVGIDKRSYVPFSYDAGGGAIGKNGFLADTIIVASYDHVSKNTVMISIPRDLWVTIPAFDGLVAHGGKINSAYSEGDIYGYPGGGLALTASVASEILGLPIHYMVRIDFDSFRKGIDILGGVDIDVERTFDDYEYPIPGKENDYPLSSRFEHLHFDAGVQYMDGETALAYARSRKSLALEEGTDYGRARRQQKLLVAARDKALSVETLLNPLKLRELYNTLGEGVESTIALEDYPLFLNLLKDAQESGQIFSYVIDNRGTEEDPALLYNPPEEAYGAWILIPNAGIDHWEEIREFVIRKLTQAAVSAEPTAQSETSQNAVVAPESL